jgi:hypothetical protein
MAEMKKISWWQWIPIFRWRIVGTVESADEVPLRLPRNGAVIVGCPAYPKWIVFDCPCRRGHRIMLNTDKTRRPMWSTSVRDHLTISPSIDYNDSIGHCHYFIRQGRVRWVREGAAR